MADKDELLTGPMTPPRAEDASLPKERKLGIEDVPGLERPLKAGPNDVVVGETEIGDLIYYNPTMNFKYTVSLNPDQRTSRKKFQEDVVPEVKKYLSDPSLPSGEQALDFGKALVTGAYDSLEGAVSGKGTYGDLLDTAGMAATGSLGFKVPEDATRIFGGKNAQNPGYTRSGANAPESVGADKKYRFEIDDSQMAVVDSNIQAYSFNPKRPDLLPENASNLGSVIVHDEFFSQYPELKDIPVVFNKKMSGGELGNLSTMQWADGTTKSYIQLNPDQLAGNPDMVRRVLIHEMQHAVQRKEGFDKGTYPGSEATVKRAAEEIESQENIDIWNDYRSDLGKFKQSKNLVAPLKKARDFILEYAKENNLQVEKPGFLGRIRDSVGIGKEASILEGNLKLRLENIDEMLSGIKTGKGNSFDYNLGELKSLYSTLLNLTTDKDAKLFERVVGVDPKVIQPKPYSNFDIMDWFTPEPLLPDLPPPGSQQSFSEKLLFNLYQRKSGEVEAENAAMRADLSLKERFELTPENTELTQVGIPRKRQWGNYNQGGLTMDDQMNKLFAEGGINTEETNVDPVSGNEVPPGSLPSEVRDDVDAKLSGGEYVVPADVLRYYGVAFFEKLRTKAKAGLGEMDADGRIGGGSGPEEEDFPFSVDDLESEDYMAFGEGGAVPQTTPAVTGFNPNDYSFGGSMGVGGDTGSVLKKYKDKDGNIVNVLFINGKPIVDVEALGYTEYKEDTPVGTGEKIQAPEGMFKNGEGSDRDTPPDDPKNATPIDPAKNYYNMAEQDLLTLDYKDVKDNKFLGAASLLSPGLALGAGVYKGITEAKNLADARARSIIAKERGFNTTALDAQIAEMEKSASGFVKAADIIGLDGTGIASRMKKDFEVGGNVATPTTPTRSSTSSTSRSGSTTPFSGGSSGSSSSNRDTAPSFSSNTTTANTTGITPASTASTGGKSVVGYSTTDTKGRTTGNKTAASSYTGKASDYSLGKSEVNQNAYNAATSTSRNSKPMAKGGLVEKPKKVVKTKTQRKTKI